MKYLEYVLATFAALIGIMTFLMVFLLLSPLVVWEGILWVEKKLSGGR